MALAGGAGHLLTTRCFVKVPAMLLSCVLLCGFGLAQDQPQIPARVLRTAEILGVDSEIEELLQLRATSGHDAMREMVLTQRLQGKVIATALDVDSVNARIDYESARLGEVQAYLSNRRDKRVNLLNVANLLLGTGVGAVGSGLQLIGSAQHAGNIVSTSAGFGGTFLSVLGLRQPHVVKAPGFTPAMLAKPLGEEPGQGSEYPANVWAYLSTPDPNLPRGESGEQHLMFEWKSFGHLDEKLNPKTIAALTSTGKDGTPLSIDIIGDRLAMLADLRAHVSAMQVDLAELMRWVVSTK
jgi:hypothetical protein